MSRFVFILGHVPVLSSIEARVLVPDLAIQSIRDGVLIGESDDCDPMKVMIHSGGLVKIARHYAHTSPTDAVGVMVTALQELVPDGKITFGISVYGEKSDVRWNALAMQVKNILKQVDRAVRHVYSKGDVLNTVTLLANHFDKSGHVECVLILRGEDESIDLFITEAFQDVGEYTQLEEILKLRDDRSGVLPLRLSKMLLHIAGVKNEHTLLDPFCGSGMLVGVAALRGIRNIIASDSAEKAVHNTLMNLGSLKKVVGRNCERSSFRPTPHKQFVRGSGEIPAFAEASAGRSHGAFHAHNEISRQARDDKGLSWQVEQRDVRELSKYIQPASIDRIVTEPYLGPSNRMANQQERVELSKLYIDSFGEFKKVLKSHSKVLFIFPVFESIHDFSQAQDEIAKMGFAKVDFMKDVRQFFPGIEEPIYSRPQQRVKRLITMWELNQ